MNMRKKLKLKPLDAGKPDSQRVYEITQRTVEDFNIYVEDFFETIRILKEKLADPGMDAQKREETEATIQYVEQKIEDLTGRMQSIANEMSALIEVTHHHEEG